jgi:NodT family efflux transporter outer membrane factor (OMF) lipoprotein
MKMTRISRSTADSGQNRPAAIPKHAAPRLAATVLLAALVAAGCAGIDDRSGRAPLDDANGLAGARTFSDAAVDARWPESDWWKSLGDPQLDRLEAEALTGSPSLKAARTRVTRALALAGIAGAARRPRVDVNLSSTRQRFSENDIVPPPFGGSWQTESRLALDFGYELDFWGKNRAALTAALGEAEAARADAFAARLLVSVAVARAYVHLAQVYDRLDVAEATLAQRRQVYDLTRQRVAAGLDTRVELKQAEAAVPATREEIAALNETVALTRHQLAALLGQGPDRGLAIARPALQAGASAAALPSRLPADLLGRRPDVAASRWRVEAAAKDIVVAKARFYPDVNLLAFAGFQSIELSSLLKAGSHVAGIGPAVRLPVFEGGRLKSDLAGANADYDIAVEQYNQTLVEALRDIGDQLAAIRSVAAQSSEQRIALDAAREAYDLSLQRYREGVGNYLSVLSTEAQVLTQRRLEADLRAREYDNRINLIRALGGGFEDGARTAGHLESSQPRRPS